jgi:O-antigen/teichoic acid export membrane protein
VLGAESGLGSYGARQIERSPHVASTLVPQVAVLRMMLGVPAYFLILFLSQWLGMPGIGILSIYGLLVLVSPFFIQWLFQGLRQMQWVATASALRYGTFAALILLLVHPAVDTRVVAVAEVSGALMIVAFNFFVITRRLKLRLVWTGVMAGAIDLGKQAWYLGASDLAWAAMWYSPSVITGWLAAGRIYEVAWMAAAVRIVMAIHSFVWLYFFNMIPNLSKEIHEGLDGWRDLLNRSMATSMWGACLIALGGTLFAPLIVETTYGMRYTSAVLPFQIAIWMIPVAWFSGHYRFSLIASGHQRLEFLACAAGGIATIIAAYVGFRAAGAPGAAAALVFGGVVNLVLARIATFKVVGSVSAKAAHAPVFLCITAGVLAFVMSMFWDPTIGAVVAVVLYLASAASQWNLTRMKHAWEGRLT